MYPTLTTTWLTLASLTLAALIHARPKLIDASSFQFSGPDWRQSSNYLLYDCTPNLPALTSTLNILFQFLETPAATSADNAPYRAFFKTASPTNISLVLHAIAAGTPIPVANDDRFFHRPVIVCVNERDEGIRGMYELCVRYPTTLGFHIPRTYLSFLCPLWFMMKAEVSPPPRQVADCGAVNAVGTALVGQINLSTGRMGALVMVLTSMYIPTVIAGGEVLVPGVRGVNGCLGLSAGQALLNPWSYASYVTYLRAGCTRFPANVEIGGNRGLLEEDWGGDSADLDVAVMGDLDGGLLLANVTVGNSSVQPP